jgi:hypothetical protein
MTGPRFDQWLLAQVERPDPVGDSARDFRQDRFDHRAEGKRLSVKTADELLDHLYEHFACPGAIEAVERAAVEYATSRS